MRRLSLIAIQMICLISLLVMLRNAKTNFLRCIGYINFTKDRIKLDLLNIDNPYFEGIVSHICPPELQYHELRDVCLFQILSPTL